MIVSQSGEDWLLLLLLTGAIQTPPRAPRKPAQPHLRPRNQNTANHDRDPPPPGFVEVCAEGSVSPILSLEAHEQAGEIFY